ncbi:MAG TPA: hypothetical protein VN976_15815 [Verrucomicrobiae bacterium]|nr:hypothetical protein [Verrucomicrobiae bacterium]
MKRLLLFILLTSLFGLASCGSTPTSTAVTCTTNTSTSSTTTSTSTCTDPVTNISVTISPATVSVNVVTTQQFQDFIQGGTNNVTIWQVNGTTGGNDTIGKIDSNGLYHAPVTVPSPAIVTVGAVSFEDQKVAATSAVTIVPAPVVTITSPSSPVTVTSGTANTVTFSATETGGATSTILWSVGPMGGLGVLGGNATLGTISASGVYSPPLTPPIGQTVTVTAAAQDSPTSTASLAVTISGYSTSSLQGPFAFSMAGNVGSAHFFRAGSFVADGAGNLSSVLEDTDTTSGATSTPISTTGSYTVGADGRGTLQFNDGLLPASFDFVLVNGSQLQIIGFDGSGTASGQANAQNASAFSGTPNSALNGIYVFDFAGVDGLNGLSQIGEFNADGAGNVTSGSIDINDGGVPSSFQIFGNKTVCPSPPASLSTYLVSSNGRGTLTLTTCAGGPALTLNFYVVNRGAAKFVGTDTAKQVAGFTSQQSPNATLDATALNGNYAFLLAGSGLGGTIATAGSFFADGRGNLTSGVVDENVAPGAPALGLPIVANLAGDNYTVASNGRGTATFTTAGRTYTFVFYLGPVGSNTTAVFQETDSGIASDGNFTLQQSGPFTLASIQGNYAIETSGVSAGSLQVSTGQIGANGAGAVTSGNIDTNTGGTLASGQAVTGAYTAPAATGRATLTLNSGTLNYAAYVVSPTQVYILGILPAQLAVGALLRQF